MTNTINILIVEDDDAQYETYEDTATDFSNDDTTIVLTRKTNAEEAKDALMSSDFDGALVDLNLSTENPDAAEGNEVLTEILGTHRFPVFIVSGNLGKLEDVIKEKESWFLRCYDRTEKNENIFNALLEIHSTGITRILGGKGELEEKLGKIFWTHLATDMTNWEGQENIQRSLLRYTISHLSEYLDEPSEDDTGYYSEAEFYIKPPIRNHIAPGDISNFEGQNYIVLSPACDVAVRGFDENGKPTANSDHVILAKLIEVSREDFLNRGIIREGDNSSTRKTKLDKIVTGQSDKFILLPGYQSIEPSVIDLQRICSTSLQEYVSSYTRVATVSGPFLKDIQSRFSSYYGRQGQPDLNKKQLTNNYNKRLSPEE